MDLFINNTGSYESFQILPTNTQDIGSTDMDLLKVKSFESCRLCLSEIQDRNITLLDGIIKDMLEIILPELNLSICETPSICKTCLETLKQSYNFKSSCLEVEDKVQEFVNPKSPSSIDLKQVLKEKNNIYQISETHVVCRTCLGLGEESNCTKLCSYDGDPLKNMVEKCLPEMGIDLTKDPMICPVCLEQLEEQFHFIMQCLDTEEKINYYCENKNIFKQVDLHRVYLFSMMEDNEYVEKHYGIMENGNLERVCTEVKIENNLERSDGLKSEPVKNSSDSLEFVDLTTDMLAANIKKDKIKKDHVKEKETKPHLDNLNVKLFEQPPIQAFEPNRAVEEVTFQVSKDCNGDDIITSRTSRIHGDEDSDVSITSESELLKERFVEKVGCNEKSSKHGMKAKKTSKIKKDKVEYKDDNHEDSEEASDDSSRTKKRLMTRKCKDCNFKTKYTSRMKAHRTVNHSGKTNESVGKSDQSIIKCKSCTYKTNDPEAYKEHKKDHRKEKQQDCHICGAVFVRPDFLKKHIENHQSVPNSPSPRKHSENHRAVPVSPARSSFIKAPRKNRPSSLKKCPQKNVFNINGQFLKMFKCQICPYQTRMRSNLVRHSLTHKKTTEIITHKCKLCNFETIQKENFLSHMQSHANDSENLVKKCFLCSFQPKTETALKQHVNMVHKSSTG